MNTMIRTLLLTFALVGSSFTQAENRIEFVEFKDAAIEDATRILAAMTGSNIAVTQAASGVQVNLLLRDVDLKHAVDTLARVSGLWYRFSKSNNSYLIMTEEQYQGDIVVYRDDIVRTFTLRHQNTESAARTIKNLYGDRVEMKLEDDNNGFEGLRFDTADQATVVIRTTDDEESDTTNNNNTNNSDDSEDKDKLVQIADQELSSGVIKELGKNEQVDSDSASRLLGATSPIYVTTNAIHNLVFVRTSDENAMAEIARIIKETDRPTPQVLLEMKIVRIDVGDEYDQDFDLTFNDATAMNNVVAIGENTYQLTDSPFSTGTYSTKAGDPLEQTVRNLSLFNQEDVTNAGFNAISGGFYQFYSRYVNARVSLLEKNDQAEAIAKPVVMASNNRPARLFIGEEQVIATELDTSTLFSNANESGDRSTTTTSTLKTERRKVGNTLILLPSINADRTVTIDILQETSTVKRGGLRFPYFDNTENQIKSVDLDSIEEENVKTVVVAKDGLTIALGGMIDNSTSAKETRVPLLGDLPLLGELFKSKTEADSNSQYVMLLTPHILLSPEESKEKSREISEFDYDSYKEPDGSQATRTYDVAEYVELSRYAVAQAHNRTLPETPNITSVPVAQQPLDSVIKNTSLVAWPIFAAQRDGLHITTVKVRNQSDDPQTLALDQLPGDWLAATSDQSDLSGFNQGSDSTYLYLLSNKPFAEVTAGLDGSAGETRP